MPKEKGLAAGADLHASPVASRLPAGAPAVVVNYGGSIYSHPAWTRGAITFEDVFFGTWSIRRVAVDEATGSARGEPVPLLTSVATSKRSSWSRDGRRTTPSTPRGDGRARRAQPPWRARAAMPRSIPRKTRT